MAPFRQDSILIIYPRSQSTLVQFGLSEETFTIPELEFPTLIYRSNNEATKTYEYKVSLQPNEVNNYEEIRPIRNGKIEDIEAFLHLLRFIYASILKDRSDKNPVAFDVELSNIPLLLITHYSWSQLQLETIVQFVFEDLQINNLMLLPSALAASSAMVSLQNCLVIDIGKDHTDIIPVMDYVPLNYMATTLPHGGNFINEKLSELLPHLNEEQIECLKRSPIYEVLTDDVMLQYVNEATKGDQDEGIIDVAEIVTSGRDTREILEERERKQMEKNTKNTDLDVNSFWDLNGNQINVGKQRFQGCEPLMAKISRRVGLMLSQAHDAGKIRAVWENVVIMGGTSAIPGFKEVLVVKLIEDNLVTEPANELAERQERQARGNSAGAKKKNKFVGGLGGSSTVPAVEYSQVPTSIKLAKYPDYFPEWKKAGYSELGFLGAQIVARQVFAHNRDNYFIKREQYSSRGPMSLWDVQL